MFHVVQCFVATHLETVETFAIDAYDGTLRYEGGGVYLVYDTEDDVALALLGQHKEHLYLLAAVEAVRIDGGATAMGLTVYALAYLPVLVADNEKLNTAAHGVDHLVDAESGDIEHNIAVDDLLPVLQHEV